MHFYVLKDLKRFFTIFVELFVFQSIHQLSKNFITTKYIKSGPGAVVGGPATSVFSNDTSPLLRGTPLSSHTLALKFVVEKVCVRLHIQRVTRWNHIFQLFL